MAGDPRIVGPLSAVAIPLADAGQKFTASAPFQKFVGLACFGAVVLGFCGFFAGAVFSPGNQPSVRLVFCGIVAVAFLLLVLGVRYARGPRDPIMALTSIATPAGLAAGMWFIWGPQAFSNPLAHLLGIPFLIGFALRLFLALRGMPGDAQRNVRRHIEQNEVVWRSARRR
jgi:hypothetical protein